MDTWNIQGIATDGSLLSFIPGTAVAFAASSYGDEVALNAYQGTTHVRDADGSHECIATHLNNTAYVSGTQIKINGGSTQTLTTSVPSATQVPLRVSYTNPNVVTISNVFVQAYDLTVPEAGPITGIGIWALEQGVWTSWRNINGTSAQLSPGSGSSTYTWHLGLSASPTTGNPKVFGLHFSLTWI